MISHPAVSRIHAVLEWFHDGWQVRDLSRNGTWLDGSRLSGTESIAILSGCRLSFGERDGPTWQLVEASEPHSMLLGANPDTPDMALTSYLFLPDEAHPELVVYYSSQHRCYLHYPLSGGSSEQLPGKVLEHGARIATEGREWDIFLADSAKSTELMLDSEQHLNDYQFQFDLSLDEESTRLQLKNHSQAIDLGERSHHYLLCHLARHRSEEAQRGVDNSSQGWVDNELLAKELGVDVPHLNILIFRARKQITDKLIVAVDCEHLVERRKGQVRFGCTQFMVHKGDCLTHEMQKATAETAPTP